MNTSQPLVHHQFAARAASQPDEVAVMHGEQWISYAELDRRADGLAHRLRDRGVEPGAVVMVHLERSIDAIVSLLAVLKAGAAYLPVQRGTPGGRIEAFVKETRCATVIAREHDVPPFAAVPVTTIDPAAAAATVADRPAGPPDGTVDEADIAYVIYTSGSTGSPNGVLVDHGSLSYLCGEINKRYRIGPADRVLQFAALPFDTSLEQIMVALLNGATLVLPEWTWAPSELAGRLRRHAITVMDLTPAYWRRFLSECARDPVELPVRLAIVGGEAVRAEDCREALRLMPRTRLINAYGLTEATITSCTMELTVELLPSHGAAPVGRPLPGTHVYLLDDRMRPVEPGERGEIYLGGRGVARGYLAEEAPGRARFLPDRFAGRTGMRMFRTGDIGRWTPERNLEVLGRVDRQLKIRGFRVEPGEIEATIATHESVDNVAVKVWDRNDQQRLVAYYSVPRGRAVTAAELRRFTARLLPDHLVPTAYVELPDLPLTPNGKIDLDALPAHDPSAAPPTGTGPDGASATSLVERGVARLWCAVLDVDRVGPEDNFFALGGTSIQAAELMARIRGSFGILIGHVRPLIELLLDDTTLRDFAAGVQAARTGTLAGGTRKPVDFAAEAEVGVPIRRQVTDPPDWRNPARILLTGATGFLGIYLLRELLTTTDAVVHCLVRADDAAHAMERIRANARHYLRDDLAGAYAAGRVVALAGDLAEPLLGLSTADFDELARTVDVIHHPGGRVNFVYPYEHMRPANVGGTREIVRLAGRYRNIPIHYTSTMAVIAGFGTAGRRHVTEDTPPAHPDHLSVGYVESKWVAEVLLRNAARQGLPVAIYRAADISGDCVTGAWNTATEMCAMKRFVVDTGTAPVAELPLDYTPVDRFAAAVVHIAGTALPAGEVYHLTNPGKVNIAALAERLRQHGYPIRHVPWDEWLDQLVRIAVEQPEHPMTPFAPLFIDRCATGRMSVAEMYLETTFPTFTRSNVDRALRGSGIEIPPVDAEMLDRYLTYLMSIGFLPSTT
ncbi:non-ribosomal peptide synthetase family protein [Micromonospora sp. BQ11]|uniref:non-ribosomal peptide synthetase family protein n=1 Tax=Micromonospora sp. BQ11 TaxID=3452212 RepID=UPI003F887BDB